MTIWNIPPTATLDRLLDCYEAFFVTEKSLAWYVNTWLDWGQHDKAGVVVLENEWVLKTRNEHDLGSSQNKPVRYLFVADEDARSLVQRWHNERQTLKDNAEKIK